MASQLRVDKILPVDGAPTGGGGGVIQVVHSSTGTLMQSTTIDTHYDTNLSATITPKFNTSKILITVAQMCSVRSTVAGTYAMTLDLVRTPSGGSSVIIIDGDNGVTAMGNFSGRANTPTSYNYISSMVPLNILDEPATTSAITYKTTALLTTSNSTMKLQEDGVKSFITLMELSA